MISILGSRGGEATLAKNPLAAGGLLFSATLTIEGRQVKDAFDGPAGGQIFTLILKEGFDKQVLAFFLKPLRMPSP